MTTKRWIKTATYPLLAAALASPLFIQCGGGLPGVGGLPSVPSCPDMSSSDGILSYDWAGSYKIDAPSADKIRAGVAAAIELKDVAKQIDADLRTGCGALATDLGAPGDFKTGKDACDAAMKAVADTKVKLGKATIAVDITPPKCGASLDVVADCAAKCDATVKPGSAKVDCEPGKLQGTCSGGCSGSCDVQAGAKCEGTCSGKCDGKCNGKCDGATSNGTCAGNCDGACSANCQGSCQIKAKAQCSGTCSGGCDVEMKAPKCTGEVKPPQMSAECSAHCNAKAEAKVECTPAHIGVSIKGGDAALAAKLKTAIEKDLPLIVKVALGMGDRVKKLAENVKTVVEGVQSVVKTAASGAPTTGAALTACVTAPFTGALDAASSMSANVTVSVNVSASVSSSGASGGGSASASAGAH
jgi:hypothetical protein